MLTAPALIVLGSPRAGGTSDTLARLFAQGAASRGLPTEQLALRQKRITPCIHCSACARPPHTCRLAPQDEAEDLLQALERAPLVLFCGPVYFYGLPAHAKALVDRAQSRWQRPPSSTDKPRLPAISALVAGRPRGERLFSGSELGLKYFFAALGRELNESRHWRGMDQPDDLLHSPAARDMRCWGEQWAERILSGQRMPVRRTP